jgi:hypothetical protein
MTAAPHMLAHAYNRPPSAAKRWLKCAGSVALSHLYTSVDSEQSLKGTEVHALIDNHLNWGLPIDHPDPDMEENANLAVEWLLTYVNMYAKKQGSASLYVEQRLDIPETGEFGTCDGVIVAPEIIHVIDYKNGYVPVEIHLNEQLMLYLCGAIAKWGERQRYRITIIQPNYDHKDGAVRTMDITEADLAAFRIQVADALVRTDTVAGPHCKTTYCPHRGNCEVFAGWIQENLKLGYYPSDATAMSDDVLAEALEQAELLQGWRDQLRGEAIRRILHQDKSIKGYKLVRAKKDRSFRDDEARDSVFVALKSVGATDDDLYDRKPVSVAGVERVVKKIFKKQGRGAWQKGMEALCGPDKLETQAMSLTLEKTIDGRKEYKKGSEFDALKL